MEFISTTEDFNKLKELEQSLWLPETRFNQPYSQLSKSKHSSPSSISALCLFTP